VSAPIFISYASADQRIAESICDSLQSRGHECWIACRNIGPGENFQESIVKAIRSAKLMILVFTGNANNSDEIKKEVVLAGRHRVTVVPVRVEDVAPNDALAYEFATRQWVDLFKDWHSHMEQLATQIGQIPADQDVQLETKPAVEHKPGRNVGNRALLAVTAIIAILVGVGGIFLSMRPPIAPSSPGVQSASATPPAPPPSSTALQSASTSPPAPPTPSPAAPDISADESAWQKAINAGMAASYKDYLAGFSSGVHTVEARRRIAELEASEAPPPPTQDRRPFDGQWTVTYNCPKTAAALAFRFDFVANVKDGHLYGQRGTEGAPTSLTLDGQIQPDGNGTIRATGYTGPTAYSHTQTPPGVFYAYQFAPRFEAAHGSASAMLPSGRTCDFTFVKK